MIKLFIDVVQAPARWKVTREKPASWQKQAVFSLWAENDNDLFDNVIYDVC